MASNSREEDTATAVDVRKRRRDDDDDDDAAAAKKKRAIEPAAAIATVRSNVRRSLIKLHANVLSAMYAPAPLSHREEANALLTAAAATTPPISSLLSDVARDSLDIPWRAFWRDAYVKMCASLHFFDVPPKTVLRRPTEVAARLFSREHLRAIADRLIDDRDDDDEPTFATASPPTWPYSVFRNSQSNIAAAGSDNDRVYETSWPEMRAIASAYITIVWRAIDAHARACSRDGSFEELCAQLALSYERAMLGGHVLLAAPLSQFAALDTVLRLNDLQKRQLLHCRYEKYGSVFNGVVMPALIASMQYATLTRGLRSVDMWPLDTLRWPISIANHAALALHHFSTGLIAESMRRGGRSAADYATEFAVRSRQLGVSCEHDECAYMDDDDTLCLARYLRLTPLRANLANLSPDRPIRDNLLERDCTALTRRRCYACGRINQRDGRHNCATTELLETLTDARERQPRATSPPPLLIWDDSDGDDNNNDDGDLFALPPPREARRRRRDEADEAAEEERVVSSSTTTAVDRSDNVRWPCGLKDIARYDRYTTDEKIAMTDGDYVNLLAIDCSSSDNDELLAYQAHGMRKFPLGYDRFVHLTILRRLFVEHTARLVTSRSLPTRNGGL